MPSQSGGLYSAINRVLGTDILRLLEEFGSEPDLRGAIKNFLWYHCIILNDEQNEFIVWGTTRIGPSY